jgi:DNA-binding MarR family transcriptional regulator
MNEIFDINLSLPAQLFNAGRRIAQLMDQRLEAVGLSGAKLLALQSIVSADETTTPVTVTCLADTMNTTKSNVTAMVDRLIAEGLVTRNQSQEDRRTVVIALTDEGHQRYEAGVEVVRAFDAELSAMFTPDEQNLMKCVMDKLRG